MPAKPPTPKKAAKKKPAAKKASRKKSPSRPVAEPPLQPAEGFPAVSQPADEAVPPRVVSTDVVDRRKPMFLENVLRHPEWSIAERARCAGYSETWARKEAYEVVKEPEFQERLQARLRAARVETDEILRIMVGHMRHSIADVTNEHGFLDMEKAYRTGGIHSIKTINHTLQGSKVQMYDSHAAAQDLAKIKGLYQEPSKNEKDIEAERERYERMITAYTKECEEKEQRIVERDEAISTLALVDSEIHRYCK